MQDVAPIEIGITAANADALIPFYTGTLGFTVDSDALVPAATSTRTGLAGQGYRVVRLRSQGGYIFKIAQPIAAPRAAPARRHAMDTHTGCYVTFIVSGLHGLHDRLRAAGAPIRSDGVVEVRPGVHLMLIEDPEGNFLEFVEHENLDAYLRRPAKAGASTQ